MKEEITTRKRAKLINLRVLEEDFVEIQKLANQKGIPVATYCYLIVKEAIDQKITTK